MGYLGTWSRRLAFYVPASLVDNNVVDFPVRQFISASSGISNSDLTRVFNEVGANSLKIAITSDNGTSECYVEIEQWDSGSEVANIWFKAPSLSSTVDTLFYLYYDITQPDNTPYVGVVGSTAARTVWDTNYKMVLHMNQDPTGGVGSIKDSTIQVNNASPQGSMVTGDLVNGAIGKALNFDGADEYLSVPDIGSLDLTTGATVEVIVNMANIDPADAKAIISKEDLGNSGYMLWFNNLEQANFFGYGLTGATSSGATQSLATDTDQYLAGVYDGSDLSVYLEGALENSAGATGSIGINAEDLWISRYHFTDTQYLDAIVDEVRISDIGRSAAWINTTKLSNYDTLITYGDLLVGSLNQDYSLVAPDVLRASLNQKYILDAPSLLVKAFLNQNYELKAPTEVVSAFLNQMYVLNGSHVETEELVDIFYTLTLDTVEIPMSSFQGRSRTTGQDYAAIVVPNGMANVGAFEGKADTGSELIIKRGGYTAIGHQYVAPVEFLRVLFETMQYQRGGRSSTLNVVGHKDAVAGTPKGVLAKDVQYVSITESGKRSVRCMFDSTLRPGDQLELPDASLMEVGVISYTIGSSVSQMQVTEA